MTASSTLPPLRTEFTVDSEWGPLSSALRRYEIATPEIPGPVDAISRTVGCIHAARASLIVRIGGGHLRAPTEEIFETLVDEAPAQLGAMASGPAEYVTKVVSWLEKQQQAGFLERSYTTATLLVAVSDSEAWTWLVSPHGLVHGRPGGVVFVSTDLRYPALRRLGVMNEPAFRFPGAEPGDKASSICCLGRPAGYEMIRTYLAPGEIAVALERGSLPFGPWPAQSVTLEALWAMDTAWRHGLAGRGVVLGTATASDLALPPDWQLREVPIGP